MIEEKIIHEYVENNAYLLDEDTILALNKNHNNLSLNNVIVGTEQHCFSTFSDVHNDNIFNVFYVTNKNTLEGMLLKIQLDYKYRNEVIFFFSSLVSNKYKDVTLIETFNTFQHHLKSIFERLGYFTYDDEFDECSNPTLLLKGKKGAVQISFYSKKKEYKKIFNIDIENVKQTNGNKIYL